MNQLPSAHAGPQVEIATLTDLFDPQAAHEEADLAQLRYMAQRLYTVLHQLSRLIEVPRSIIFNFEEATNLTHRIAIYRCQELLRCPAPAFVGFISQRRTDTDPQLIDELEEIDKRLVSQDLGKTPGLLSYSSMEKAPGHWSNLVVFDTRETPAHIQSIPIHQHAAYNLSPQYYEWIRLHHGRIDGGLSSNHLVLNKTKYYSFHSSDLVPQMREQYYSQSC